MYLSSLFISSFCSAELKSYYSCIILLKIKLICIELPYLNSKQSASACHNPATAAGCELKLIPVGGGSMPVHCYASIFKLLKFRWRNSQGGETVTKLSQGSRSCVHLQLAENTRVAQGIDLYINCVCSEVKFKHCEIDLGCQYLIYRGNEGTIKNREVN